MFLQRYYLECLSRASLMVTGEQTRIAAAIDPQRDINIYLDDARNNGTARRRSAMTITTNQTGEPPWKSSY